MGMGLSLSRLRLGGLGGLGSGVPEIITATLTPASSALYETQNAEDTTSWATFVNAANYSSTAGSIVSAVATVTINGSPAVSTDALTEDDVLDFSIAVTDSATNLRAFDVGAVTVQYFVQSIETAGNELSIDVNPIVDDAVALPDVIIADSDYYNATYTGITAGDLNPGPFNLGAVNSAGLPQISGTTGLGDTLTAIDGLWTTPTGTLTLTRQWQSDGVDIPGATGATFDITASEQGTDVTVEVTGDDGVNTPVVAESAATSIPAASGGVTVTSALANTSTSTGTGNLTDTIPGVVAGEEVFLSMAFGKSANTNAPTITFDGNPPTSTVVTLYTNQNAMVGIYRYTAPSTGDIDLVMATSGGTQWRAASWRAYRVSGRTSLVTDSDSNTYPSGVDLSNNVLDGDVVLACLGWSDNGADGTITPVNLTLEGTEFVDGNADKTMAHYRADPTGTETPRTMTLTPTTSTGADGAIRAVMAILR